MRKHLLLIALLIATLATGCTSGRPAVLRVLTYNIHHGEGLDGRLDLERIARIIRAADADLVALQEVDRGVARTKRVDQPAVLAQLTDMHVIFEKNINHQGGAYGNAVLSRLPIERHHNHTLPGSPQREQRGALELHVRFGDRRLVFLATHFDYHDDDTDRIASAAMLRNLAPQWEDRPLIVAGDLNALPGSPVIATELAFLIDSFEGPPDSGLTYPADKPDQRIDYILHNGRTEVECVDGYVIAEPLASDHRPVLAVFKITGIRGGVNRNDQCR